MSSAASEDPIPTQPSKNALRKAAKEAEKMKKKEAARQLEQQQTKLAAQDTSADRYGKISAEATPVLLTSLTDLPGKVGESVTIDVFLHNARNQSAKLSFLLLRGGTGTTVQAVVAVGGENNISRQMVKWAGSINCESYLRVTGLVLEAPEPIKSATLSGVELHIQNIYTIAQAITQLPIQIDDAIFANTLKAEAGEADTSGRPTIGLATRLDNRVLDLRVPVNQATLMIKSGVDMLFYEFMGKKKFTRVHTPRLIGGASEGGANVFTVDYFGRKAFLAQSPQLYKQMLIGSGLEGVFEVGPVFRAENSNTHRHMTEFTGLDFEMRIKNHYHEVIDVLEELFLFIFRELKIRYSDELAVVRKAYPVEEFLVPEGKMLRLNFADGIKLLKEDGININEYEDLSTANERRLGALIRNKYKTDFYVLDQFPLEIRPFYTKSSPHDPKLSNSYDFFMRGEEILSGAQRIHDQEELINSMKLKGVDPKDLKDYVDVFGYGMPPHGGGGIGLDRVVFLFLGLPNIRLATAYPRDPVRLMP